MHCVLVLTALLGPGSLAAGTDAQDASTPATARAAVTGSEPQVQVRLVGEFSGFAGSDANARSLVTGLRQAAEITLTAPGAGGQAGAATRLVPPTRPMDYGNIRVALVLAREQLAQLGITRPTPGQIKAVLAGGGIASNASGRTASPFLHPGLLQMRAGGMSWAGIAGTMGITLAQAKDGRAREAVAATPDSNRPAAAKQGGGSVPQVAAGPDVPPLRRASATPAPISSASITTSSAGGPRTAPAAKPSVAAQRSATTSPGPEIRRPPASVVVAADAAPRVEKVAIPAQDGAQGGAVRTSAAAAPDELTGSEEGHATE